MKFKNVSKKITISQSQYTWIVIPKGSLLFYTPDHCIIAGIFYHKHIEIILISKNFDNFYFVKFTTVLCKKNKIREYFKRYCRNIYNYGYIEKYRGLFND